jgi:hypothetical protein
VSIGFGLGLPWGAVSQFEHRRMAKDERHLLTYRVYFAALGYANRLGHAEFGQAQLATVLAKKGRPLSRQGVQDAVDRAKSLGLVLPDSGSRCLVLGTWQFQKGGQGTRSCAWHGIRGVLAPPDGAAYVWGTYPVRVGHVRTCPLTRANVRVLSL